MIFDKNITSSTASTHQLIEHSSHLLCSGHGDTRCDVRLFGEPSKRSNGGYVVLGGLKKPQIEVKS